MAGAIHGLGLSQWRNADGTPMAGAKLYVFLAETSTPADAFKDFGLTPELIHPHPILTDASGLLPSFWVNDGQFRVRLVNADGSLVLFDEDGIQAIGPSSGEGGGGGGVDSNAIFQTGHFDWQPVSGTRSGWVRANFRTIGSATSGASERANADVEPVFLFLWNTYSDTLCPVGGGRGANAAADWAANKTITTLDMKGIGAIGLADMGGTDSTRLDSVTFSVGNKTTAASLCGAALHTLAQAELPNVNFVVTIPSGEGSHTHDIGMSAANTVQSPGTIPGHSGTFPGANPLGNTNAQTLPAMTGTAASGGSGTAANNMQPSRVGTWYIRL